jgi:hypothetical protein
MKTDELLEQVFSDGIFISKDGFDLKITGDEITVGKWIEELKTNKEEIVRLLSGGPVRTWTPGNPFLCQCGSSTGWRLNAEILCPACFYNQQNGADPDPADNTEAPKEHPEPCKTDSFPTLCQGCAHLETVEILGRMVSGCLYEIPGAEFSDGWRRLPNTLEACLWN